MTESHTEISRLLREATDDIAGPIDLARVARRVRRYRRNRLTTGLAGTVAVSAIIATAAIAMRSPASDDGAPVTGPTTSMQSSIPPPPQSDLTPYEWALQLPRGDDALAAWFTDGVLHIGPTEIPMGRTTYVILAEPMTDGEWLASMGTLDDQGIPANGESGVLHADGSFDPFAYQWRRTLPYAYNLSPDGSRVVIGGALVDVATGQRVGTVPDNLYYVAAWTDQGIVYDPPRGDRTYLWSQDAGGGPVLLDRHVSFMRSDGIGVARRADCDEVVRLRPDETLQTIAPFCGDSDIRVESLSPSGELALNARGSDVIDVAAGEIVATLPVPRVGHVFFWEDEDNVVFDIQGELNAHFDFPWVFVRCTISTETCERASDVFTDRSEPTLVALSRTQEGR